MTSTLLLLLLRSCQRLAIFLEDRMETGTLLLWQLLAVSR
jgi:hypothetical protein